MSERIQKALAAGGYGSRRRIEELIKAGRISINGAICELGAQVEPGDKIRIDGRLLDIDLRVQRRRRVIALHKAEGVVATMDDPEGRPTVFDRLPQMRFGRWISIGRLDINTTGLLLLTNDGELANRLMHPSHEVEREYAVRVLGEVDDTMLKTLREGVMLEDGPARFERLVAGRRMEGSESANNWFHVSLAEGRNREVRRLWEAVGVKVSRLSRVRYGPIVLPRDLPRGRWRELEEFEVRALCEVVGLPPQEAVEQRSPRTGRARPPAERDPRRNPAPGRGAERGDRARPERRPDDDTGGWRSGPSEAPPARRGRRADDARGGERRGSPGAARGGRDGARAEGGERRGPPRRNDAAPAARRGEAPVRARADDRGRDRDGATRAARPGRAEGAPRTGKTPGGRGRPGR